jgi:apolipoprotein N-acyltransferase
LKVAEKSPIPIGSSAALRGLPAYGAAVLCGFLYFLAFPGIDVWPLSFVALVPLIVALRGQTPRRAFGLGWAAGFTMTMAGFYWLLDMLKTFSGFPTPLCVLFMAILCGYQAGRIGLAGLLSARAERRGWPPGLAFTLAFAASELVYPLLFPWYYGATVRQLPALTQVAELGGPIAVALVLVAANLAVAEAVFAWREKRTVNWRKSAGYLAIVAIAASYGAIRIPAVDGRTRAAPHARVGLVQANMSLEGKRVDQREGLRRHVRLTRELQKDGDLDLVVWSETSVMSAVDEKNAGPQLYSRFARQLGVPALFGGVLVREVSDEREYVLFNSALLTDRTGHLVGRYDKQFLLAFGEYLPFGDTFPILYRWSPNSGKFTPGSTLDPLPLAGHDIATFICYEDINPGFVNSIVRRGAPELLANLTNDAWFGDTTEPWIHLALSQFRAIEHRRFFVRSTNSGISAFVDPVGRIVSHTEPFKEQALAANIAWLKTTTPYELWGDVPWWAVSLAIVAMGFVSKRGRLPLSTDAAQNPSTVATLPGASDHPDLPNGSNMFWARSRAWFQSGTRRHGVNEEVRRN